MAENTHPDEFLLLAHLDGETTGSERLQIERHLASCAQCAAVGDELSRTLAAYQQFHASTKVPFPPAPWADLRPRMIDLDAGNVQKPSVAARLKLRWVAAVAAVLVGVLVFRAVVEQPMSAAELLNQAVIREQAAARNVTVKTRGRTYVRVAGRADTSHVADLFRHAGYNWDEPLSARSYADWRSRLRTKEDRVSVLRSTEFGIGRFYQITTTTPEGFLAEGSITLRASDFRPVQERFRFRSDETVEVTEAIVQEPAPRVPESQIATAPPEAPVPASITPNDELPVIAALHAIGADLGEPVEIRADSNHGKLIVSALTGSPERQQQIRSALAGIPKVELRFERPEAMRSAPGVRSGAALRETKPNSVHEALREKLGGSGAAQNFIDHVLDLSEAALARAHALRALAQRFTPEAETQLTAGNARDLARIQEAHTKALLASSRQLTNVLRNVAPSGPAAAAQPGSWQATAADALTAAQKVDKIVSEVLGGGVQVDEPGEALAEVSRAAQDLERRAEALQTAVARTGGPK